MPPARTEARLRAFARRPRAYRPGLFIFRRYAAETNSRWRDSFSANELRQHICLASLAELQSDLIIARRESTFLRYRANAEVLQFLYAECYTRNRAVSPQEIVADCRWRAMKSSSGFIAADRAEARNLCSRDFLERTPWAIDIPPR